MLSIEWENKRIRDSTILNTHWIDETPDAKYDNKNRVISMQVEGSGTTGVYTFRYNDSDQIIDITGNSGDKYKMTYDKAGKLLLLTVDGGTVQKQLEFKYGG